MVGCNFRLGGWSIDWLVGRLVALGASIRSIGRLVDRSIGGLVDGRGYSCLWPWVGIDGYQCHSVMVGRGWGCLGSVNYMLCM